jgi:hypothetical protein
VSKKTKKSRKPRKPEKKINRKNQTVKKKPIKQIKILKKPAGSVRFGFGFISLKPKKPNRTQTRKKLSQTGFGFFYKKFGLIIFLDKNRTEPKIITPIYIYI